MKLRTKLAKFAGEIAQAAAENGVTRMSVPVEVTEAGRRVQITVEVSEADATDGEAEDAE